MAPKQKKSVKGGSSPVRKAKDKGSDPILSWILPLLYGVLGGLAFYFLHPILNFKPSDSGNFVTTLTAISFLAAFFGATRFFQQYSRTIALWTVPFVGLQILVNLALTYEWIGQEAGWMVLASMLTIPTGIIWFFILKSSSDSDNVPGENNLFALRKVFGQPLTKIAGLVILCIAGILCFYRLGYYDIWEDENLVINAAKGFYENGFSYFNEGYDRAWLHTIICSGFFEVFGISEFSGRLPSAIFGIGFVLVSFYVFARWYGLPWLALLIPLVCLMNDRFLILFRYMRMYALLIPVFLAAAYVIYNTINLYNSRSINGSSEPVLTKKQIGYTGLAFLFFPLLAHIHKLSMVMIPAVGLLILYMVLLHRNKNQMRLLFFVISAGLILMFLTFVVELDAFRMFRQAATKMMIPHAPMTAYFEYVFENGLPRNSTIMILLSGLGLLGSGLNQRVKSLLMFNYLLGMIAMISMVYLIQGEGRDYRYTAHIVPFVVCNLLVVSYYIGRVFAKKTYPWILISIFLVSTLMLIKDYERVYVKHPWAPRYSVVYATLQSQYKPGDALFARNIKTYYLDPIALAGEHYHKISKKGEYTKKQFLAEARIEGHGWVMWELHKSHHWSRDILEYIYKNFKPVHTQDLDKLGVALFYYDETMIKKD